MNFNFNIIDLEKTLIEMKTGFFVLATIAGIHTFTVLCWFGYRYFNEQPKQITEETETEETKELARLLLLVPEIPPILQMDLIDEYNTIISESQKENIEKEFYHNMVMFQDKKNQLEELIEKLSNIQNNLEVIREKLTELNNPPSM